MWKAFWNRKTLILFVTTLLLYILVLHRAILSKFFMSFAAGLFLKGWTSCNKYSFEQIQKMPATAPEVKSYIVCNHLFQPSSLPYNLTNESLLSPSELRLPIWNIFQNISGGFFVECGANDGEFLSNTLDLELRQNWKGLLIEPHPSMKTKLLEKRRKAWFSNVALSPTSKITQMDFLVHPKYTGNNNHGKQGVSKLKIKDKLGNRHKLSPGGRVHCFPLASVLAAINVNHVDFLSLDIEGQELAVLKTLIPLNNNNSSLIIDVIMAEFVGVIEGRAGIVNLLHSYDYQVIYEQSTNVIMATKNFVHKNKLINKPTKRH